MVRDRNRVSRKEIGRREKMCCGKYLSLQVHDVTGALMSMPLSCAEQQSSIPARQTKRTAQDILGGFVMESNKEKRPATSC